MQKHSRKLLVLTAAISIATAFSTQAQSIAYDGFNYPNGTQLWGTTPGQGDGGTGWASTWSATSAAIATNTATGLSYGDLQTSGGAVVMGNPNVLNFGTTGNSERILPNNFGNLAAGNSGVIWVSFLYQNLGTDMNSLSGFRQANLGFFVGATTNANGSANVNGSERLDIGSPNTYAAGANDTLTLWSGSTFVSSGIATPRGLDPANTVFIVLEFIVDTTAANDTVYAWFNPDLNSQPDTGDAISLTTLDLSGINGLRFQAGNANASGPNAAFIGDELRVGLGWGDVAPLAPVPEPTTAALAVLGGAALLMLRKRK